MINDRSACWDCSLLWAIHSVGYQQFVVARWVLSLKWNRQGSQLSWNSWNFKSALKLSWNLKLSREFTNLATISWKCFWCTITCCSLLFYLQCSFAFCVLVNSTPEFVYCPNSLDLVNNNSIMTALFSSDIHEWFLLKKKSTFTMCI